MEGRGDPDTAPSARCHPARAASCSFASDVAGPCVAGAARRDAASRAPRGDAAGRHSRNHLAMASRHRAPPVGAPVTPGPFRAHCYAPQGPVRGAAACPGERVLGLPPDPRRAGRARHHRGAVHGLADPQERRDRPGAPQGRPGLGRVPRSQAQGILALDFSAVGLLNGTKVYVVAVIEHGTPAFGSWEPPGTRPSPGSSSRPEPAHGPGRRGYAGEIRAA